MLRIIGNRLVFIHLRHAVNQENAVVQEMGLDLILQRPQPRDVHPIFGIQVFADQAFRTEDHPIVFVINDGQLVLPFFLDQEGILILFILHGLEYLAERSCKGFSRVKSISAQKSHHQNGQSRIENPEKTERLFHHLIGITVNQPDSQAGKQPAGSKTIPGGVNAFFLSCCADFLLN